MVLGPRLYVATGCHSDCIGSHAARLEQLSDGGVMEVKCWRRRVRAFSWSKRLNHNHVCRCRCHIPLGNVEPSARCSNLTLFKLGGHRLSPTHFVGESCGTQSNRNKKSFVSVW